MDEVKIRPLTLADNDAFFVIVNDDRTAQAAGFTIVATLEESAELLTNVTQNQAALAVIVNDNVVGVILLSEQVGIDGMPDSQNLELAFMLQRDFQHRGIMTIAMRQLLKKLTRTGQVTTLIANVQDDNVASKQVLLRVGFVQVGTFSDFNRQRVCQFEIRIDK